MPTHEEVIAQNPLEAPAPFWTNVLFAAHGFAAFFVVSIVLGGFVLCCVSCIQRVERWESGSSQGTSREADLRNEKKSPKGLDGAETTRRRAASPGNSSRAAN
eukprot:TRINITY_DN55535_c0_g1_i1.p1 TRINITY_DN55535_c0_g1~~TRINITY_DN55535_c0_g1_i1.p1  ORF type:complete len:103 (+),score=21.63 TRINITY_DN55535_c0_g1_i1:137-445(+)